MKPNIENYLVLDEAHRGMRAATGAGEKTTIVKRLINGSGPVPGIPASRCGLDGQHCYVSFPQQHRTKLHSANPLELELERLNGETKRRTDAVSIFPNEAVITRLVGAILLEQNDEWSVQRARYISLETISEMGDDKPVSLPVLGD